MTKNLSPLDYETALKELLPKTRISFLTTSQFFEFVVDEILPKEGPDSWQLFRMRVKGNVWAVYPGDTITVFR